jgi:hypothetical protein
VPRDERRRRERRLPLTDARFGRAGGLPDAETLKDGRNVAR